MNARPIALSAMVLAAVLLAACGSSPKSAFYMLGPDPSLTADGAAMAVNVVVGPVTVPDVVDRPQLVTRLQGNEVAVNEFARWAAPLKSEIARAIAADLAISLGSSRVSLFDTDLDAWRVRLDVMRFEATRGDAVTVEAQWTVRAPRKAVPSIGRTVAREPIRGEGYDAMVTAYDRALADVGREIAGAIRGARQQ